MSTGSLPSRTTRAILRAPLALLLLLSVSLVAVLPVAASDGDLDPSFAIGGKVITPFLSYQSSAQSVAIQSDGKIVAGGISMLDASTGDFALARYNANGTLDPTFGVGGKVITDFGANRATIYALAIYKSGPHIGKIVAVGDSTATGRNFFALARYNIDGSLDTSFGSGTGKVTTDFGGSGDISPLAQAFSVALQGDDKIVLGGAFFKFFSNGWDFALARYNDNGSLDTTFGGTGKVITDIGGPWTSGGGDAAYSVAIQSDGKILAGGYANPTAAGDSDFALLRYNTNGTLDTSFGPAGTGKAITSFGSLTDYGKSIAIQTDGKVVMGGQVGDYPSADFALARYNTNGTLDTSFDADGKVTTNIGGWDMALSVAIQVDGKIVAAGQTQVNFALDFALARYSTGGSLDTSFDIDGKVTTDFGGGPDVGYSVAIQSDGKIVVAGHGGASHSDFAVARYSSTSPNQPPTISAGGPYSGLEAAAIAMSGASASDPNPADTLTYAWSVDSTLCSFSSATALSPNLTCSDNGSFIATFAVNDGINPAVSSGVSVTVSNIAPTAGLGNNDPTNEGGWATVSFSGQSDPSSNDALAGFHYAFDCNGGSLAAATYASSGSSDSTSCVFTDNGSYTVNGKIIDKDGGSSEYPTHVTVNNVAPIASLGNNGPIDEGGSATVSFSNQLDPSSNDTLAGFHYAFDCNGGSLAAATYASSGSSNSTSCAFTESGSHSVSGKIFDKDGGSNSYTTVVNANNVAPVITSLLVGSATINENGSVTITGNFTDVSISDTHMVSIKWGDGGPSTLAVMAQGAGGGTFTAVHQYLDDDPTATVSDIKTIEATVTDDDGGLAEGGISVTVNNLAPVITGITVPTGPQPLGGLNVSATFTDAGSQDTHTCTIDWDEGLGPVTGTISNDPGDGSCGGSHVFTAAGVYAVTVKVIDDDTGSVSLTAAALIVVFDPSVGFVTGGGWYNSLPGSDRLNLTAKGRANFGFVAKYKKGASAPDGQTEFQFQAGALNFHSTAYQFLVVTGGCMAQYKGTGTVNGVNGYTLTITVRDGEQCAAPTLDGFRIKITGPNGLRYDNRFGDSDDIGPQSGAVQGIDNGSIMIHRN